jgi:hypothetical protein
MLCTTIWRTTCFLMFCILKLKCSVVNVKLGMSLLKSAHLKNFTT